MTSKEALDMLRTTYNLPADIKANYGEIIAKDLKILEILKKSIIGVHAQYLTIQERNIIKEWLDNDK